MTQWRWRPEPLEDIFPDGTRWVLESLSDSPGYWKYEGRVCKHDCGYAAEDCGYSETMKEAAEALFANITGV